MLSALTGTMRTLRRSLSVALAVMALVLSAASPSSAANRLALVIGNDTYNEVAPLARAVSDARAYRKLLEEGRGFRVFYAENAGRDQMNQRVSEFLSAIEPGDTAMVVYSGHGVQLETERRDSLYLLPTDFPNRDPGRGAESYFFDAEALNFARLAENVARRGAKLRIFVLDACRNNPFNRENSTRAIGMTRGIGRIQSSSGEFVIYAAAPGEVAFDSLPGDTADSVNSLFTRAFIKHFREGVYLEDVANDVQAEVVELARSANVEQEPYYSDGVAGRTCIDDACGQQAVTSGITVEEAEREELFWGFCEGKDEPAYCQAYLAAFPDSWRAPLARARLAEMNADKGGATAAVDPKTGVVERKDDDVTRDTTEAKLPSTGGAGDGDAGTEAGKEAGKEPAADKEAGKDTVVAALDPEKTTGDVAAGAEADEVFQPTRDEVRDTQARLAILGHQPGPIDGLIGGRTRSAISAFKDSAGLPPDGEFTRALMARLDAAVPQVQLDAFYAERAAAAQAAAERAARERAERDRAARERAEREKVARENAATDRATRDAAAEEAARRAAAAKAAAEREAAAKAAAEKAATTTTTGTVSDATNTYKTTSEKGGIRLKTREIRDDSELPFYCHADPRRKEWDTNCQ